MTFNENELIQVFNLTQGRCFYCGRELAYQAYRLFAERGAWVVDCFIPVAKGGADGPGNWAPCCLACSHRKGESLPWEFDPERFRPDVWEMEAYLHNFEKPMVSDLENT